MPLITILNLAAIFGMLYLLVDVSESKIGDAIIWLVAFVLIINSIVTVY